MIYYAGGCPPDELYHHGILGQKWGVRRYQNADGSYTNAGRERYGIAIKGTAQKTTNAVKGGVNKATNSVKNMNPETKKKIIAGTTISVGAIATAAYLYKHPDKIVDIAAEISSVGFNIRNKEIPKLIDKGKEAAKNSLKNAKKEAVSVGTKALGAVAVKKISDYYEKTIKNDPNMDEDVKLVYKTISDEGIGYVKKKTGTTSGGAPSGGGSYSGKSSSEIQSKVGNPASKHKPIDKSASEWSSFMSRVPSEAKPTLKKMAADGYSYEQLQKVANEW